MPLSTPPMVPTQRRPSVLLSVRRPDLKAQWDPENNPDTCLDHHSPDSIYRASWICSQGHRWQATIRSRCRKRSGCRRCTLLTRLRAHDSFPARSLRVHSPAIADTWHPDKNGTFTPDDVTYSSRARVWWRCPINATHIWCTSVNNRQRSGCPFCAGRYTVEYRQRDRNIHPLSQTHKELAELWHPTLNGTLKPEDVTAGSKRIVWWCCPQDETHLQHMSVYHRTHFTIVCRACQKIQRQVQRLRRGAQTPLAI